MLRDKEWRGGRTLSQLLGDHHERIVDWLVVDLGQFYRLKLADGGEIWIQKDRPKMTNIKELVLEVNEIYAETYGKILIHKEDIEYNLVQFGSRKYRLHSCELLEKILAAENKDEYVIDFAIVEKDVEESPQLVHTPEFSANMANLLRKQSNDVQKLATFNEVTKGLELFTLYELGD